MPLWSDIRFAVRQLRGSPTFTLIVLAKLGLCFGANTAIYSVLDGRPAAAGAVSEAGPSGAGDHDDVGEWRRDVSTPQRGPCSKRSVPSLDVAAYSGTGGVNFGGEGRLEFVQQHRVSAGYFRLRAEAGSNLGVGIEPTPQVLEPR
jgi:hypothetical protein